jgi:hypothetical protein
MTDSASKGPVTDSLFRGLAGPKKISFSPDDPYRDVGYASLMQTGLGPFGPLPPQLRECHSSAVDTVQFEEITLELRSDSLRGFSQEEQEGELLAPIALVNLAYDTVARLLSFDLPTAPRTLLSFDLSPSCDSLAGIYRNRTAYHPQDKHSGASSYKVVFHKGPHRLGR